jgi:integrase
MSGTAPPLVAPEVSGVRQELTDRGLRNLSPAPTGARYELADGHVVGLRVRVGDRAGERGRAAAITFVLLARFGGAQSNPTRRTLGRFPQMSLSQARQKASEWKQQIERGIDPGAGVGSPARRSAPATAEPPAEWNPPAVVAASGIVTFNDLADDFLRRHVEKNRLRTEREVRRQFVHYLRPRLGPRPFREIRRREIVALMDDMVENNGPAIADRTLATLSKMFAWQQARDDEFVSPIVRGMKRVPAADGARDRVLSDAELRAIWKAADDEGLFGMFVQFALLTAQRREKILEMEWAHLSGRRWELPELPREKGTIQLVDLPDQVMRILGKLPRTAGNPFVFAGRSKRSINGISKCKARLDRKAGEILGAPLPNWRIHDLRRTARTRMPAAKVDADTAERILGHALPGIRRTYDKYEYVEERSDGLRLLADYLDTILFPPPPQTDRSGTGAKKSLQLALPL